MSTYLSTRKWNFEPIKVNGLYEAIATTTSSTTVPIFNTTSAGDTVTLVGGTGKAITLAGDSITSTGATSTGTWITSDHVEPMKEWVIDGINGYIVNESSPRTMFTIDDIKALLTDDVRNSQEKFINKFMEIIESKADLIKANGLQASDILLAFKVPEGD